jgi:hypothetical protein
LGGLVVLTVDVEGTTVVSFGCGAVWEVEVATMGFFEVDADEAVLVFSTRVILAVTTGGGVGVLGGSSSMISG